jgi:HD superfamily phosphodiesterase
MQELYDKVAELFNKKSHIAHDIKHVTRTAGIAKFIAAEEDYDT